MKKNKILVTSALPYVNNVPHLGNLICIISGDVYTRFLKLRKEKVVSVLGTDEHGTTTEVKAIAEGLSPRQIVDKYYNIHKKIYDWFLCDYDCFGRTSSKKNHEITQDIFIKLFRNGYIIEQEVEQTYCESCQKFLADRFVEGTCPHCGYENAKGDQCENCGKLLNAPELKEPRCVICGSKPIIEKSNHLFINLPKLAPKLKRWLKKVEKNWSQNARTMTHAWLREGLKPRCITRDLKWGIPVPLKGFETKVFYSWFDAPIGYISITAECRKDWKKWWMKKDTKLVQFMGKDNIPFHSILFPSSLIGTGDDWVLVSELSVNEYLNYEKGQFSKSRSIGVFGDDAMKIGIPADAWRYYLIINRPEKTDSQFSWKDFQEKINKELVANLGNLVNRTMSFLNQFYDSKIPKLTKKEINIDKEVKKITELLERVELKKALKEIMTLSKKGNQYFQKNKPWEEVKKNKQKAHNTLANLVNLVKDLSILIYPYMPNTSKHIQEQLNIKDLDWNKLGKDTIKQGHKIGKAQPLFKKLEDKEVEELKIKYSGKRKDEFAKIDLRVARIEKAEDHPKADKLVVLEISLGKQKRTLVAGLKEHYPKNIELIGKHIIVLTNLKPALLRGVKSQGMLLAAQKGDKVKLILAPESQPGDLVYIEGLAREPEKEIAIQDFQKIQMTTKQKKVIYKKHFLRTDKEYVTVNIGDNAIVR
jgi:methionyl-tRNA synthetase